MNLTEFLYSQISIEKVENFEAITSDKGQGKIFSLGNFFKLPNETRVFSEPLVGLAMVEGMACFADH